MKTLAECPVLKNQKDLRNWLGLATYFHKYSKNYAEMARPLSNILKKGLEGFWNRTDDKSFREVVESLLHALVLACQNLIDLSVSSVTLLILPLAVL